jgi:hypothetical protein
VNKLARILAEEGLIKRARSEINWGVHRHRFPWFDLADWPPRPDQVREIDRIVQANPDEVAGAFMGRTSIDADGNVVPSGINFRPDGKMDVYLPMLRPKSVVGIPRIRGLMLNHALMTPDGRLLVERDRIPLPSAVRTLRQWLQKNAPGLRKQRGRGVYRRGGVYIRFGKWGPGGSRVFLDEATYEPSGDPGFDRKYEAGVSVYRAEPRVDGGFDLVGPNPREALYSLGSGYMTDMLRKMRARIRAGEVYLLGGTRLRTYGADGEPLLDPGSVQKLAELDPSEVFWMGKPVSEIVGGG